HNKTIRYGFVISEVRVLLSPVPAELAPLRSPQTAPRLRRSAADPYTSKGSAAFLSRRSGPSAGRDGLKDGDCKHACAGMLETVACNRPGGDHPPCPGLCHRVVDRRAGLAPQ